MNKVNRHELDIYYMYPANRIEIEWSDAKDPSEAF